ERVRTRGATYRRREPTTALVVDTDLEEALPFGRLPLPDPLRSEAISLVKSFRAIRSYSDFVQVLDQGLLPTSAKGFDSIDQLIIASRRVGADPAGLRAARAWVERGGHVWVMLD